MNEEMETVETIEPLNKVTARRRQARPARPTGEAKIPALKSPKIARLPVSEEDEEDGFFQTHGGKLVFGAVVLLGAGWLLFKQPAEPAAPARKAPEPQMVRLVLPQIGRAHV